MKTVERFLLDADDWPLSAVWRVALGIAIIPVFRLIVGEQPAAWMPLALFIILLAMLRVGPAVLRRLLPFSQNAKETWRTRRFVAKRHDSYQWQKLFWIGLGLLSHRLLGGLSAGEWILTLICLVGGAAGLYFWRGVSSARSAAGVAKAA